MYILGVPFGFVMRHIYEFIQNYGLSIVAFTVIVRLLMLPLAVKQQKSSAKMAVVQPQIAEIQKKYANNQQKMSEEMQALYAREGFNPLGGCLPALIQFPIIMGLYDVIYKPLTHMLALSKELIEQASAIATSMNLIPARTYSPEPYIISAVQNNPDAFQSLGADVVSQIQSLDMNFLGINLGAIPTFAFNLLLLIPVASFLSSLLMTFVSMRNMQSAGGAAAGAGAMKVTMYMMPLMSGWIAFQVPAGVGLYWTISNILSIIQTVILHKFYNPKEMAEKARQESEERKEREREARQKARELAKLGEEEAKEKALKQKEINRQKLAAARKREAEKYGEVYVEVTDKDLE